MEKKLHWIEVDDFENLPGTGKRCLFESRSGFRFYGKRTSMHEITMLASGKIVHWLYVKRWANDGTGSGD